MQGIREANFGSRGQQSAALLATALFLLAVSAQVFAQAIPQKNVNAIGPTPVNWLYAGNPRMQQNEPECAVSPNNPEWIACGFNDYRAVNFQPIGDAFPGIAMSRDLGKTWISGLAPQHLADTPNIGQKFGADANLEALPNLLLYNFIAGWRDDSQPGGVYISRWYEHNREIGPPWEFLDTIEMDLGTSGRFLDKPAFDVALSAPGSRPDIEITIPAFSDPRNLANSHDEYTLKVPAARAHMCYSVFVGNDNNNGTKINCLASDDGGATWPIKTKLTEGVEINQGVSLATKNFGQEVLAVWRRFSDNNETSAIMFAKSVDEGNTWTKAEVLTEFCAFDQTTGAARFRTNALPVVVSSGDEFAVFFASRNDASETCFEPPKNKNSVATPLMSYVALEDDFDTFGEPDPVDGVRSKDGQVRTALNFSRIMMVRGTGDSVRSWSDPIAIDPQTAVVDLSSVGEGMQTVRKRGHQFMPAAEAAGGIETVAWYDSRLDKLNTLSNPIAGGFVEDLVVHFKSANIDPVTGREVAPWNGMSLLPAGAYDIVPPPPTLPPNINNMPLRRTIDVFASQIDGVTGLPREYSVDANFYPAGNPGEIVVPDAKSTRVTRFPTRRSAEGPQQAEWNYPNGRLFRKGKSSFIGDYNSVTAAQFRQLDNGTWVPNQSAPVDGVDLFPSLEPMFHIGWTSNRNVRGRVFYTGCDQWDETLQMWVSGEGCDSSYTDPIAPMDLRMMPLQGEDGGANGPPLLCVPGGPENFPLTRNQNIYVAAMKPGFSANVLSAIKPPVGTINTFVVGLENGSSAEKTVVLELPDNLPLNNMLMSFDRESNPVSAPDLSITVTVPRGSSNTRTVFDFGNVCEPGQTTDCDTNLLESVVLTVRDCLSFDDIAMECDSAGSVLARVPLQRNSLTPLENTQNKLPCDPDAPSSDPNYCVDPINLVGDGEFYDLILKREQTLVTQSLDLENLDLENTVQMLDLENLDLENLDLENLDLENLDLENLDLENLDLENVLLFLDLENLDLENLDLENALYEQLDLENLDLENDGLLYLDLENLDLENTFLQFLDLENLDLENLDLENLDLENLDLENLDLENLDLENLDLENQTFLSLDLENLDLENLDLENTAPGDNYTEISWTADSATNTTTGVDVKPIFSPTLATALNSGSNSKVLLTVRRPYMTSTVVTNDAAVQYCAPQVVVENQLLYAAILDVGQINSLIGDPDPNDPNTPSFVVDPDQSTIITLRFINPPFDKDFLNANTGVAIYAQPGGVDCDSELSGDEVWNVCEIDYVEPDSTPPVISLVGAATMTLEAAVDTYEEQGATALDDVDGPLTVTIGGDAVLDNVPGTYVVTYNVSDAAGNPADQVIRTVIVQDTTAPVILLNGSASITLEAGVDSYIEQGATASDLADGDLTGSIMIGGDVVNDAVPGTYVVTYNVSDSATNAAIEVTRTVTVEDTTAPVILLNGSASIILEAGIDSYIEQGATASDNADGDLTASIVIGGDIVNDTIPGTYVVTYDVSDAALNAAVQVTRTVTVQDTTAPVITIIGGDLTLEASASGFVDPGASALDAAAGDLTAAIMVSGTVDTSVLGTYTLTYSVTDGYNPTTATRTVTIVDTTDPGIIITDPPVVPWGPFVLPPGDTLLPISWPVASAELAEGLSISCTVDGAPATLVSSSYADGTLTANFSYDFPVGTSTVTCTVTDQGGNTSSELDGTFTVFVEDVPTIAIELDPDCDCIPVTTDDDGGSTATVFEADLIALLTVNDFITDPADLSVSCLGAASAEFEMDTATDVTCTVTDTATPEANSASVTFPLVVSYRYDFFFDLPKGRLQAGSTLPVDFYYEDSGTRVDASTFAPAASWTGPYNIAGCAAEAGSNPDDGNGVDAGSSSYRWSDSKKIWQFSWQTPPLRGSYFFTITPPGTAASTIPVCLK